jgi:hypothetical protein
MAIRGFNHWTDRQKKQRGSKKSPSILPHLHPDPVTPESYHPGKKPALAGLSARLMPSKLGKQASVYVIEGIRFIFGLVPCNTARSSVIYQFL